LGLVVLVSVDPTVADAAPTPPGKACQTPALDDWSDPEKRTWGEICEGRIADFSKRTPMTSSDPHRDPSDPESSERWGDDRKLSQAFLETILTHDPFRSAIPRQGARIVGAFFPEKIDLANAQIDHELWLDRSRFENQ